MPRNANIPVELPCEYKNIKIPWHFENYAPDCMVQCMSARSYQLQIVDLWILPQPLQLMASILQICNVRTHAYHPFRASAPREHMQQSLRQPRLNDRSGGNAIVHYKGRKMQISIAYSARTFRYTDLCAVFTVWHWFTLLGYGNWVARWTTFAGSLLRNKKQTEQGMMNWAWLDKLCSIIAWNVLSLSTFSHQITWAIHWMIWKPTLLDSENIW